MVRRLWTVLKVRLAIFAVQGDTRFGCYTSLPFSGTPAANLETLANNSITKSDSVTNLSPVSITLRRALLLVSSRIFVCWVICKPLETPSSATTKQFGVTTIRHCGRPWKVARKPLLQKCYGITHRLHISSCSLISFSLTEFGNINQLYFAV